jgi:hypothetical protein
MDYQPGRDTFDLTGVSGVHAFGDLQLTQLDRHTVLVDVGGGDTITIEHMTVATLNAHQGDFLFA